MPGVPTSKACEACRRVKKKCDLLQPKCSRCLRLNISCEGSGVRRFRFQPMTGVSLPNENRQHWAQTGRVTRIVLEYQSWTTANNVSSKRVPNDEDSALTISQSLNRSISGSPCVFSSTPELDRRLEQELMHRWRTRTLWVAYNIPKDVELLRECLPRAALSNGFLLKSLFAIASADLVHSGQRAYIIPALEYHANAINDMNLYLSTSGQKDTESICIFSFILAVFNFIITPTSSPLKLLNTTFDMLVSVIHVILASIEYSQAECQTELLQGLNLRFLHLVDFPTQAALQKLTAVSYQVQIQITDNNGNIRMLLLGEDAIYQAAIRFIKYSFSEMVRGVLQNHCWLIVLAVNAKFFTAVKEGEPMALLIALYFGALIDRMGRNTTMGWWVGSFGKDLVKEISEMMQHTTIAHIPDGLDAIAWAREEVGLY